jgi:hypothetical protein
MAKVPQRIRKLLSGIGNPRLTPRAVSECKKVYRDFIATRYDRMSKPGSRWKKLAKSTLEARKRRGNNSRDKLKDMGELRSNIKSLIQITDRKTQDGCQLAIGFGGSSKKHSKWIRIDGRYRKAKGDVSMLDIAQWHDSGTERMPRRQILVRPDASTCHQMAEIVIDILRDDMNG